MTVTFYRACILGIYRQWRSEAHGLYGSVERDEVCSRVLGSARITARRELEDVERVAETINLIPGPGIYFWGIETDATESDVRIGCAELLEEDRVRQKLQGLSFSKKGRREDNSLGNVDAKDNTCQ